MNGNTPQPELSPPNWSGILLLAVVYSLGNVLILTLADSRINLSVTIALASLWFGVMTAQVGLVAVWGVLALVSVWFRLIGSLVLGGAFAGCFALGVVSSLRTQSASEPWWALLGTLLILPTIVATTQIPIWIARILFGWQICRRAEEATLVKPSQFSIANMLTLTTIAAILIATLQAATRMFDIPIREVMITIAISAAIAVVLSSIVVLPAIYAILRVRDANLGFGGMFVFAAAMTVAFPVVASKFTDNSPPPEAIFAVGGLVFGTVLALIVPLTIVRGNGYRLVIGRPTPEDLPKFFEGRPVVRHASAK